jgi:UDP-N-acetylmuramate dehydrogenase
MIKLAENIKASGKFSGEIRADESLAPHTTIRTGGTAPLFVLPDSVESLVACLDALHRANTPYFVLGGGSNVVFPDGDFGYVVVATEKLDTLAVTSELAGTQLHCGAGCKMDSIVRYCTEHKLGALEEFSGLPGTVGGAVYMNARCYGKQVSDVLVSVGSGKWEVEHGTWSMGEYCLHEKDWGYKESPFQGRGRVILEASFAVNPLAEGDVKASREKVASFRADRERKRHFDYPSAGSVFKNNHEFGKPSGMIIGEAGLRGYQIGGAQVAPWHGNFIVNTGNATSADIHALADYVAKTVFTKFGFRLEPEIIFL